MFLFQAAKLKAPTIGNQICNSLISMYIVESKFNIPTTFLYDIMWSDEGTLRKTYPFLKYWGSITDCFAGNNVKFFDLAYNKAYGGKGNTEVADYIAQIGPEEPYIGEAIKFRNAESVLKFTREVSKDMTEGEKIQLIAAWQGILNANYDDAREKMFPGPRPGKDVLGAFLDYQGNVGICGDINGSAGHLFATAVGLKQASLVISTSGGAHIVSLVKGRYGYYLVDYGDFLYLGKDMGIALDKVKNGEFRYEELNGAIPEMRISPFIAGVSQKIAFEESTSAKALQRITGYAYDGIREGLSAMTISDMHGNAGTAMDYGFKKITIGAYILGSPVSETLFGGVKIDYSRAGTSHKVVVLPRLFVATMGVHDNTGTYLAAIAQAVPIMFQQALWERATLKATPIALDAGFVAPLNPSLRLTSTAGLISEFGANGKRRDLTMSVEARWVAQEDNFYSYFKPKVATRLAAGFETDKYAVSVALKPESMANKLSVGASGNFPIGKKFDVMVFANVEMLPEKFSKEDRQRLFDGSSEVNLGCIIRFDGSSRRW